MDGLQDQKESTGVIVFDRLLETTHRGRVSAQVTLPLAVRVRSRARIRLDDGREAAFVLPRGRLIRGGELLASTHAEEVVRVVAAAEAVSSVRGADCLSMARLCYHLGNRHVPLQIGPGLVRYLHDHVLDELVRGMGLAVLSEHAPFEPEAGAYRQVPHVHE